MISTFCWVDLKLTINGERYQGFPDLGALVFEYDNPLTYLNFNMFSAQSYAKLETGKLYHASIEYGNGQYSHLDAENCLMEFIGYENSLNDEVPVTLLKFKADKNSQLGLPFQ